MIPPARGVATLDSMKFCQERQYQSTSRQPISVRRRRLPSIPRKSGIFFDLTRLPATWRWLEKLQFPV